MDVEGWDALHLANSTSGAESRRCGGTEPLKVSASKIDVHQSQPRVAVH